MNPTKFSNYIIPGKLAIGGYPFISGDRSEVHTDKLIDLGVNVWVSLVEDSENFEDYTEYVLEKSPTSEFLKCPIPDRKICKDEDLFQLVENVHQLVQDGKFAYVHCHGGHGRSGTFAACFLMRYYGYDSEKAIQENRSMHSTREHHPKKPTPQGAKQYAQIRRYKPPSDEESSEEVRPARGTKAELIERCRAEGFTGLSSMNKAQLQELLDNGGPVIDPEHEVFTLTFGEQAENHVGMEILGGGLAESGFSLEELENFQNYFSEYETELIDLTIEGSDEAYVLIIRNGISEFISPDELLAEQRSLNWDKKALFRGVIKNKNARWNLCYDEYGQEPDYGKGKGRIINFDDVPCTYELYNCISDLVERGKLKVEGNYYYDDRKCGIGFHGDTERKLVIAVRLGASMPLRYQWYQNSNKVGDPFTMIINHGDLYFMSEKATGFDWKKKKIMTLRHAAGCEKYIGK